MSSNQSLWKPLMQLLQQLAHSHLLSLCTGIRRTALGIQPAFVADTDAVLVTVQTVSTHHFQRATGFNRSITPDNVVIPATVLPTPLPVPSVNLPEATHLIRPNRTAVNNNQSNNTHNKLNFNKQNQ